jgi:hypothetical protein
MHDHGIETRGTHKTRSVKSWGTLLTGVLLASLLAFVPASAQAATEGWWPHFMGGDAALPGFWITGEITEVSDESVTLQLPNKHHARGMMRYVSLNVTLDVDSDSLLLTDALEPLELTTLAEGDDVVVVPRLVWGNLVAQLIYAGEPEDLAEATYRGKLVTEEGDTLTLHNGRIGEFTVLVDEATVWYDNGPATRPAELAEELALRVLGVETEDEAGEEVIRAVLITTAK